MRLHANTNTVSWDILHVPTCRSLKRVVWVDDETAQWGELTGNTVGFYWEEVTHQAKKIVILPQRRLILIDPVDDADDQATVTTEKELDRVGP